MKLLKALIAAGIVILSAAPLALSSATSAQIAKAQAKWLSACKKDFPEQVAGKDVVELDTWAEAQENGDGAPAYKKTKCYQAHEKWEKLAQKNEWSPTNHEREPASN